MTVQVQSIWLCHRCPYYDWNRGRNGRCSKDSGLQWEPLKKQYCHLLSERQMSILNNNSFIPVSRNLSVKAGIWQPNECFECGKLLSRFRANHRRVEFCQPCSVLLTAKKRKMKT